MILTPEEAREEDCPLCFGSSDPDYMLQCKGDRCVIIGNGPSLRSMDLSSLKDEVTFGMNRIYLLFDKMLQNRLMNVHLVFGLIKCNAVFAFQHFVGYLFAPVCRQTMQNNRIVPGHPEEIFI